MQIEEIKRIYNVIMEGLSLDLSISSIDSVIVHEEEVSDIETITKSLLLLNRLSMYASVIQGYAKELEKKTKSPEAYGLAVGTEQLNRSIRLQIESFRTILSNYREQLKVK